MRRRHRRPGDRAGAGPQKQRVTVLAPAVAVPLGAAGPLPPRVYNLSPASQRFLAGLGIWDALPASRIAPVDAMEIHSDADGTVTLNAWQAAKPHLAWIGEAAEIERRWRRRYACPAFYGSPTAASVASTAPC